MGGAFVVSGGYGDNLTLSLQLIWCRISFAHLLARGGERIPYCTYVISVRDPSSSRSASQSLHVEVSIKQNVSLNWLTPLVAHLSFVNGNWRISTMDGAIQFKQTSRRGHRATVFSSKRQAWTSKREECRTILLGSSAWFLWFLVDKRDSLLYFSTCVVSYSHERSNKLNIIMSWLDRMKKAGKTMVDAGAKTMLKVSGIWPR